MTYNCRFDSCTNIEMHECQHWCWNWFHNRSQHCITIAWTQQRICLQTNVNKLCNRLNRFPWFFEFFNCIKVKSKKMNQPYTRQKYCKIIGCEFFKGTPINNQDVVMFKWVFSGIDWYIPVFVDIFRYFRKLCSAALKSFQILNIF